MRVSVVIPSETHKKKKGQRRLNRVLESPAVMRSLFRLLPGFGRQQDRQALVQRVRVYVVIPSEAIRNKQKKDRDVSIGSFPADYMRSVFRLLPGCGRQQLTAVDRRDSGAYWARAKSTSGVF